MNSAATQSLRSAFLQATYGTAQRRYQLTQHCGLFRKGAPTRSLSPGRWAILTAWNPHGQICDPEGNAEAQARLRAELVAWSVLEGINGGGEWAEPSVIVPNLSLRRAAELGRHYQQAALVWYAPEVQVERFWLAEVEGETACPPIDCPPPPET